jgi:hypothetical protein
MTATRSPAFSKKVLVLDDQGTTTCHHRPFPARTGRLDATPTGNKVPDENDRPTVLSILPQCSIKAAIGFGMANGLAKKPIAPAFIAPARTLSSGNAVMKMKGAAYPAHAHVRRQLKAVHR